MYSKFLYTFNIYINSIDIYIFYILYIFYIYLCSIYSMDVYIFYILYINIYILYSIDIYIFYMLYILHLYKLSIYYIFIYSIFYLYSIAIAIYLIVFSLWMTGWESYSCLHIWTTALLMNEGNLRAFRFSYKSHSSSTFQFAKERTVHTITQQFLTKIWQVWA